MLKLERERLRHLEFHTFLLIDTHWFSTLEYVLNAHERLSGVFTSEELPALQHDLEYDYRGDPELARGVEVEARARGIRAIASAHRNLPVHYPTLNVMHYFNHEARAWVLPISVCQTASVKNDLAYGAAIGQAVWKSNRRVVIVASGGMSHKFWDYDRILDRASASPDDIASTANRLYDERIMEWFKAGRHDAVLAAADDYRAHCSPEAASRTTSRWPVRWVATAGPGAARSSENTRPRSEPASQSFFSTCHQRSPARRGLGGDLRWARARATTTCRR